MIRFTLSIILSIVTLGSYAQPLVSYYIGSRSEASRGQYFKTIEESSEVIIKGVAPIPYKVVKEFNPQGNIVSSISYNSAGGKTAETRWEYIDGVRLLKKHHRYFANIAGWREEVVNVEYDQDNMLPKKIELLKEGKVFQSAALTSDTLGRIEVAEVYGSTGAHITTEKLLYIVQSNMIRVMVYRANGQFHGSWTYPIDPNKEFNFESVSRQYYPNGDVMVETLYNSMQGDQAYYYDYNYDSQGNWIVKETYQVTLGRNNSIRNKKIEHRITRNITYY
jgi:hypothetical protein